MADHAEKVKEGAVQVPGIEVVPEGTAGQST